MIADSIKFKGLGCFTDSWAGFDEIKRVNVIIGRNNTGKSRLLELVEHLCRQGIACETMDFKLSGTLDEESLKRVFSPGTNTGKLGYDHWDNHGVHFVGRQVTWATKGSTVAQHEIPGLPNPLGVKSDAERKRIILQLLPQADSVLSGKRFRHLLADRDIQPEKESDEMKLSSNGVGATNIVQRFINDDNQPREAIQKELLDALNKIFAGDGEFNEIQTRRRSESDRKQWEIFLGEKTKGLVSLSKSGSGLKTVILVLLNLIVVPKLESLDGSDFVFAFEELENNLHPSLQRRLLQYIADYAEEHNTYFFLTSHSNVTLDVFGMNESAQVVHVTHNGKSAGTSTVSTHFERAGLVSELGAKPSDLLQANGVLWLEGPSDRVYLNRWIELFSDGELAEGFHYQCACYGGSVLASMQFTSPDEEDEEFVNLLRLNPNIAVVCDGDRTAESGDGSNIKDRVKRIEEEVSKIPGATIWITGGKEIESYLTLPSLVGFSKKDAQRAPGKCEVIFPSKAEEKANQSFAEEVLERRSIDKIKLAMHAAPLMTKADLIERFDLADEVQKLVATIRGWNR